jgi:vacuolar-type H+-ATPase subunit E/Vma4
MEELQSTELLDREILEDARKKAQRILQAADDTIKAKSAEGEKAISAALGELEKKYAAQGKVAVDEIMAFLPIDQRRIKTTKIEALLGSAVETWYAGLSRQRVLDILKKELAKRLAECDKAALSGAPSMKGDIRVRIHNIDQAEAQTVLQAVLPGKTCTIETIQSAAVYPEITLETPELRIHASIGKTVELFLDEKRAELVEALLGTAALPGGETW